MSTISSVYVTDFVNGSHKARLVERVRQMCEACERPCLIVEQDRLKPGQDKAAAHKAM